RHRARRPAVRLSAVGLPRRQPPRPAGGELLQPGRRRPPRPGRGPATARPRRGRRPPLGHAAALLRPADRRAARGPPAVGPGRPEPQGGPGIGPAASRKEYGTARTGAKHGVIPLGMIGMLVLTSAVETFVSRHGSRWTSLSLQDWRITRKAAERKSRACDVLCFGNSMIKYGVLPTILEARTGRRAYNLALLSGPAPASYFLFRRALAHGARPSAVVVSFDPERLMVDPRSGSMNYPWAEVLSPVEAIELARQTGDASFAGRLTLACLVPSVGNRHEI